MEKEFVSLDGGNGTKRELAVITNSSTKAYRRCPRYYYNRYVLGYEPTVKSEALRFGELFHKGLEAWWSGQDAIAAIHSFGSSDPYELAKAEALLVGYDARWCNENIETLSVEASFSTPLMNPATGKPSRTYRYEGRVDAIAVVNGRRTLIEHKTSSEDIEPGSLYWRRLRMDTQITNYLRATGCDGCLYDVIRKPALRPKHATPEESRRYTKLGRLDARQRDTDETPDEYLARLMEEISSNPEKYYQRGEVVRLENEELDGAHDLYMTSKMIRESELSGRWPRNPDSCLMYSRECEFFGPCSGMGDLTDPLQFKKV